MFLIKNNLHKIIVLQFLFGCWFSIVAQTTDFSSLTLPDGSLLSEKAKPHLILVIGQSTCPACQIDHYALQRFYSPWKTKGYQIVYVSIDENTEDFNSFYKNDPWETYQDKKGWEAQIVKSLRLKATPTLYCFNSNMELLKEAENAHQMHIWIESQLQ